MKVEISLGITDDHPERSARSRTRVRPPTDSIRQFLIVAYCGKRRRICLSSFLEELCSSRYDVAKRRYNCGNERRNNSRHYSCEGLMTAHAIISRRECCLPLTSL